MNFNPLLLARSAPPRCRRPVRHGDAGAIFCQIGGYVKTPFQKHKFPWVKVSRPA
jgi:hypothetical protein